MGARSWWTFLDGDGTLDPVLPNHVNTPATVHWGRPGKAAYTAGPRLLPYLEDIHGLSAGDLCGGSGGRHLLVSVGGSFRSGKPPWGLNPRAPVLLQINGRSLQTVTAARGLAAAKMRGRAPRVVDVNGDGRLDVVLWGSAVFVDWDKSPRQKVLVNGGRAFWPLPSSGLGDDPSEGVSMVDVNGDGICRRRHLFPPPPCVYWAGGGALCRRHQHLAPRHPGLAVGGHPPVGAHPDGRGV